MKSLVSNIDSDKWDPDILRIAGTVKEAVVILTPELMTVKDIDVLDESVPAVLQLVMLLGTIIESQASLVLVTMSPYFRFPSKDQFAAIGTYAMKYSSKFDPVVKSAAQSREFGMEYAPIY